MPTMTTNGVNLYYFTKGKGIAIIFIHPPVLTSTCFSAQVRELSRYYQTIAFDIRGHGKSSPSETPITYALIASDIRELMDTLRIDKAFICGYSTGGSVALEFLLKYPQRTHGAIIIGGISEVHDLRLRVRIVTGKILAKWGAMSALALSLAWSNSERGMRRKAYQDARVGSGKNAEQYYQCSLKYDCTDQLPKIQQPVLLVYGEKDKGFHSYAELLHQHLPHNDFIMISKVKHQIPSKAANQLHQVIRHFVANSLNNGFSTHPVSESPS